MNELPPDTPPGPEDQTPLARARRAYAREQAARAHTEAAHAKIAQDHKDRRELIAQGFPPPPRVTGVRLKSPLTGQVQDIMDDGSVRNLWQRMPGMSGRQWRKARKQAQRQWRAEQRAQQLQQVQQ